MAKRRAEDTLLHDSPSKRCYRSLCSVDLQLGSVAATAGGLSPPSLLALLGSRCRKRPYYFEDPEEKHEDGALHRKASHHCDTRKPAAATVLTAHASGSFQERRSCSGAPTSSKKRAREDSTCPEAAAPKANDKANDDNHAEDATYNSFQYWRAPLPELDLSLLEDADSQTKDKSKVKGSPSDAMET